MPLVKCVECLHLIPGHVCARRPGLIVLSPAQDGCGDGERRVSDADARDLREASLRAIAHEEVTLREAYEALGQAVETDLTDRPDHDLNQAMNDLLIWRQMGQYPTTVKLMAAYDALKALKARREKPQ